MTLDPNSPPGCMVDGHPTSPVLIIGMAPGREELEHNKPFLGGSGRLLWKQLFKKAGISRADCYIVNTIGEWPEGTDGNPTKEQYDKWWDTFDTAVSRSQARVALLLGGAALERFTGLRGGVEAWRGYLISQSEIGQLTRTRTVVTEYKTSNKKTGRKKGDPRTIKVSQVAASPWPPSLQYAITSFHPTAVLRTGFSQLPALAADVGRAGRALNGTLKILEHPWSEGVPTSVAPDPGGPTVVDIETPMGNFSTIERIGANNGPDVWTALWDADARDYLRLLLNRPNHGPAVAFNIGFDAPRLEAHGVPLPEPWWDVMLAAALAEPNLKKSLNFVASLYFDKHRHKHLSADQPAFYNAMDVGDTLALYHLLRGELARSGQLELFEKRMMPTMPVLVEMTRRGIKVDDDARRKWVNTLMAAHAVAREKWDLITGGRKTAGKGLVDFLYYTMKLPAQYKSVGKLTTERPAIRKMLLYERLSESQRAVLEVLLELRSVENDLRTYAEVELSADGCIHPGFLPAGKDSDAFGKGIAGTGRIIASQPNIQNQPQAARIMFIARDPSKKLIARDYSQAEARVTAQLSGDDVLWEAIRAGLHQANAMALGVDKTRAKNGFYGWCYGAGKRTLHRTFVSHGYAVGEAECAALLSGFGRRFRKTSAWRDAIASEVSSRYYLTNAFGRRRYFMGGSRDDSGEMWEGSNVPAALDFHPQSDVADVVWPVLRTLRDELRRVDAELLAIVHDEVLAECPVSAVPEAHKIMKEVMEQPIPELGGLVIPTEGEVGDSWGAMEAYHDAA